ncbi:TonB-linked outer membrane protein, SusC/RagA family [Pedobacter sp. ok626]|uniref:SusC/RagA family TonB-linked outer membrane protein n=1 Tax=Pedobacter sp. ok626 TaxID=1761882 RepID=UPI00088E3FDF|nr:SusC/RagA family TonB-linked outer membrane protein [Pedobacter sp. ok626]SDJ08547.1 TonB-linked outer membrane protein, SusC/RagA family [Pedobacter sp. ok626]
MYKIYTKILCWPERHMPKILRIIDSVFNQINGGSKNKWIMRINLITVLMIATFLQVSAAGFAQQLTLSKRNVSLEQVFQEIKKQTGYNVIYFDSQLNDQKKLDVNFKKTALKEVLEYCLKNQSLVFAIDEKTIVIKKEDKSIFDRVIDKFKSFDVYGTVFDDEGNVLPGATVRIKGSSKSIVTPSDGVFAFSEVDESTVLVFSYVGYRTQEIAVKGKRMPLKVILISAKSDLDEVNVTFSTGYQSIPKDRATGAYAIISGEEIGKKISPNLLERLEGTGSGLLVNVGTPDRSLTQGRDNFTIRGTSTINSEKKPLIVLDGFPTELDLVNINPDNVENITILKDAAAASIWGVRAANGVIVIESKKGTYSNKPQVNFSSVFSLTGKPRLDYRKVLNSAQYLDLEKELVDKGILPGQKSAFSIYPLPLTTGTDLYMRFKRGAITQQQYNDEVGRLSKTDVNEQYQRYLLQSPFSQQYNVSISGGSSITRNYLSASYTDEHTNNKGDYGSRMVVNFSNETKITPKLTFSAETFVSLMKQENNGIGLTANQPGTNALLPYDQIVDANGNATNFSYKAKVQTLDSLEKRDYLPWKYNYIDELANADNTSRSLAYRLTAGLNYKIMPWMSADLKYMTEREFDKTRNYYSPDTYMARNTINTYTVATSHVRGVPIGGILDLNDAEQNNYNIRGQLNFNPDLGAAGRLDAVIGAEFRETLFSAYGNRAYGYDNRLLSSTPVNYTQVYKTADGDAKVPYILNLNNRKDRYASIFGNFTYTYKSKYSLSGSFRKDDSNLFGASKEFRTVPLWSIGAMWRVKDEGFMAPVEWLSKLNLRATAGYNGNLNKDTSPYLVMQQSGSNPVNNDPYGSIYNPANPQLRWERVQTYNIGTDFSLFNSRISGSVDAYWRKSLDLLGNVDINPTYGFTSLLANKLEMKSRGVDVELSARAINAAGFSWTPSVNVSFNTNKVTKAYFQQETTSYYTNTNSPKQGQELGSLYTYKYAGLNEKGNAMIYNGKGEKVLADLVTFDEKDLGALQFQGNVTPPYFGGMSNTFTYKDFELFTLFTFKAGHKFMRPTANEVFKLPYTRLAQADLANRWRVPGDESKTNIPAIDPQHTGTFRYIDSDYFVEDASYVRWRDVTLTYHIPVKKIKWSAFQMLSVSATGRNLALWTANKEGIDPDYLDNLSLSALPPSKSIVFSIKATF